MQQINSEAQHLHISFVQLLGEGGFGKVFLADLAGGHGFQQQAAVKVLHPQFQHHPELLVRQLDEARMLGLLNHRNIVKVYDVCEINGQVSILMEYVDGISLSTLLKSSPVPWGVALQWVADCASALHDAHQAHHPQTGLPLKLIHRDIKPSNLLISKSGTLKLLDFGIAKMEGVREAKTSTHQMGTERYMAPEQWLENTSSASVDVYALGRTMLEMLHGKLLPRCPLDANLHGQSIQRLVDEIPCGIDDSVPQVILDTGKNLLLEMLSHDPMRRPSSEAVADRALCLAEAIGVGAVRAYMGSVFDKLNNEGLAGEALNDISMQSGFSEMQTQSVQPSTVNIEVSSFGSLRLISGGLSASVLNQSSDQSSIDRPYTGAVEATPSVSAVDSSVHVSSGRRWLLSLVVLIGALGLYGFMTPEQADEQGDESFASSYSSESDAKNTKGITTATNMQIVRSGLNENEDSLAIPEKMSAMGVSVKSVGQEANVRPATVKKQPLPTFEVVISSVPLGADVYLDGKYMGKSLLTLPAVSKGTHRIRLELGQKSIHKKLSIRDNGRFVWRANNPEGDTWFSY